MSNPKRKTFSKLELLQLQEIVDKANAELEIAEQTLGTLRRAKNEAQRKYYSDEHNYR